MYAYMKRKDGQESIAGNYEKNQGEILEITLTLVWRMNCKRQYAQDQVRDDCGSGQGGDSGEGEEKMDLKQILMKHLEG